MCTGIIDEINGILTINYFIDESGFSANQWMFDNGYMAQNYFIANVNLQ